MYTPIHFQNNNHADCYATIRSFPLGTLVVNSASGFEINHIPFVVDTEDGDAILLRAHIPKANPLFEILLHSTTDCAVVFQGAGGYVSPSWYATKQEHGKVVPTWNYKVVHAHGKLSLNQESDWIAQQLHDLTNQSEKPRSKQWAVTDAPGSYLKKQLSALVGLEVKIATIECKTKASQNQPAKNRESVLDALREEQPDSDFYEMMKNALDGAT